LTSSRTISVRPDDSTDNCLSSQPEITNKHSNKKERLPGTNFIVLGKLKIELQADPEYNKFWLDWFLGEARNSWAIQYNLFCRVAGMFTRICVIQVREVYLFRMMQRHFFQSGALRLSYLDSAADAALIIALPALWMQGSSFNALAARLFPRYRVVALDQRGHGKSARASDYSRCCFVEDIAALLDHLKTSQPVVILGNSLGELMHFNLPPAIPNVFRI